VTRGTVGGLGAQHLGAALAVVLGVALLSGCAGVRSSSGATSAAPSTPASASPTDTTPRTPEPTESETPGPTTIAHPADGETIAGPAVEVSGVGTAFEATLVWAVTDAASRESVQTGFTMAGSNGTIGPFSFTVDLEPGRYVLEIWEPDVSDQAVDAHHNSTSVTFTVT